MRIWSVHPKYLDVKGLVALWREALLAKNVLEGKTRGYRHHPQLQRFKEATDPVLAIKIYLFFVYEEAVTRGYSFDRSKIELNQVAVEEHKLPVTSGQVTFEIQHLLTKLNVRDKTKYDQLKKVVNVETNPLFYVKKGDIENWEKSG